MKKLILHLLAAAIFLLTIIIAEYYVGWRDIFADIAQLNPIAVAGLLLISMVSYWFRTLRIQYSFIRPTQDQATLFFITTNHNLINILVPMRLGEASFPLLMKRHFDSSYATSSAHLILYRLMDFLILGNIFILVLGQLHSPMITGVGLLIAILGLLFSRFLVGVLITTFKLLPWSFCQNIGQTLRQQRSNTKQLRTMLLLTWSIWLSKLLAFVGFCLLLTDINAFRVLFSIVVADLSSVLPIHGFAGTGTFEGGFVFGSLLSETLSVDIAATSDWLALAVQLHLYLLLSACSAAFCGWIWHWRGRAKNIKPQMTLH